MLGNLLSFTVKVAVLVKPQFLLNHHNLNSRNVQVESMAMSRMVRLN